MLTICDTHVLVFWADAPQRLSDPARQALEKARSSEALACSDISFWEIALLFSRGRLNNQSGVSAAGYMNDIIAASSLRVLPITPDIAELSRAAWFEHKDPADRLIVATALIHHAPLITADEKLRALPRLTCIW